MQRPICHAYTARALHNSVARCTCRTHSKAVGRVNDLPESPEGRRGPSWASIKPNSVDKINIFEQTGPVLVDAGLVMVQGAPESADVGPTVLELLPQSKTTTAVGTWAGLGTEGIPATSKYNSTRSSCESRDGGYNTFPKPA